MATNLVLIEVKTEDAISLGLFQYLAYIGNLFLFSEK
jgi:hypothetical protein